MKFDLLFHVKKSSYTWICPQLSCEMYLTKCPICLLFYECRFWKQKCWSLSSKTGNFRLEVDGKIFGRNFPIRYFYEGVALISHRDVEVRQLLQKRREMSSNFDELENTCIALCKAKCNGGREKWGQIRKVQWKYTVPGHRRHRKRSIPLSAHANFFEFLPGSILCCLSGSKLFLIFDFHHFGAGCNESGKRLFNRGIHWIRADLLTASF